MDTLEKKIGQMLLLGFRGLDIGALDPIALDIREAGLGGVILFDYDVELGRPERNVESPGQVAALNAKLQSLSEIPLLISVDQEGGQVARLREDRGFPPTLSAQKLGEMDDLGETRRQARLSAATLAQAGFNINFAPSVDLGVNPANPIIGRKERSYGDDPGRVVRHAREVIRAHREAGMACAIKHFPGHGSSVADTHLGFVDVTGSWSERELEPFAGLISEGECWAVMTAHVFNATLDPEWPATLSEQVIGGILRRRLGFDGVVFSDDMEMGAISGRYGLEIALCRAIQAGVDVLVFANNVIYQPDVGRRAIAILKGLVETGTIKESRIDESFERIMTLKRRIGLFH